MEFNETFFAELGKSAAVTNLCIDKAKKIAALARSTAPVDSEDYRNSIQVVTKEATKRNVVLVVAGDWKAMIIEAETGNLVRALKSVNKS